MSSTITKSESSPRSSERDTRQGRRFRTGCKTCKSRRVQCDETRPACNACVSKGRTCPGYQREFKWSTKHEVSSTATRRRRRAASGSGGDERDVSQGTPESTGSMENHTLARLEEAFEAAPGLLAQGDTEGEGGIPTVGSLDGMAELYGRIYVDGFGWLMGLEGEDPAQGLGQGQGQDGSYVQEDIREKAYALGALEESNEPPAATAAFQAFLEADLDMDVTVEGDILDGPRLLSDTTTAPHLLPSPAMSETTTFLIEYWFKNVCAMWSSFDSDRNLIRKLAASTWSHNAAVFHSLQTMSALHLAEQLPHVYATATSSWTAAMQAIQQELSFFTQSSSRRFPTGLLLALTGIGTTTCWTDSQQLGIPLLRKMKTILAYYNQPGMLLAPPTDRIYLDFFNDSCAYWDILCRVVSDEDTSLPAQSSAAPAPTHTQPGAPTLTTLTTPHPWVGVSRHILDIFANTILLCKQHTKRLRRTPTHATMHTFQALIADITAARALRTTLLTLAIQPDTTSPSTTTTTTDLTETGDAMTPLSHLIDVAEGYRLAALLHLYQTFADLRDEHIHTSVPEGAEHIWALQTQALELLELVRRIPLESGSRVIQPLLYLSIATGLRAPDPQGEVEGKGPLSGMAIRVSQGRRVVMQRVSVLEYSLPSKPIRVLKALIARIWEVGDREVEMGVDGGKHWSEVMEESELRTMFG
ncbi:Zn(II)2Cys6 transcription factor [Aspergillus homomorphus CBS 101889]|uniref:Zn(2)-C6 fungal-type domain-containing protein n=1 Tax=Aspergillus homomorphus (strain CBS 101889) TaxID=1450537 RepID=A0A395I0V7_ASPHC|nr:hypothetical protein BO97DRAFT_449896 [Aspergillus homomorphus CBS 101889]RAL13309.1 hypothetical protein BO97DRAFT_449896 [Aspergillus homomorphus CBS 101889]